MERERDLWWVDVGRLGEAKSGASNWVSHALCGQFGEMKSEGSKCVSLIVAIYIDTYLNTYSGIEIDSDSDTYNNVTRLLEEMTTRTVFCFFHAQL